MNRITIEFCPEDRQRIDELIAFAGLLVGELKSRPTTGPRMTQAEDGTVKLVPAGDHPVDASVAHLEPPFDITPAPAPDPAPAVKPISLGEFQKALVTRCAESAATKAKVQALVHSYAESVSTIPEDKRAEVLAALAKI